MLIYYLQQLKPAILPVVQELPRNPGEDYETDINKLKEYFSEWNDSLHLGRLWYGLFRFYVMEDHQSTVICIQQSKLMLREDKSWNKKRIGIEGNFYCYCCCCC